MQDHVQQQLRPKYTSQVLNLEKVHENYVKLKMYGEAKRALAKLLVLRNAQTVAQSEALKLRQSTEHDRVCRRQAKELSIFENRVINAQYQLMNKRKQETELLIRKYNATAGLLTRHQHKQVNTLQVMLSASVFKIKLNTLWDTLIQKKHI